MTVSPASPPITRVPDSAERALGARASARPAQPGGAFAQTLAQAQGSGQATISEVQVRPGDTLSAIVARHLKATQPQLSASPSQLFQLAAGVARDNGVANPNLILPGQVMDVSALESQAVALLRGPFATARAPTPAAPPTLPTPAAGPVAVTPLPAGPLPGTPPTLKPRAAALPAAGLPAAPSAASAFLVRHAQAAQRVQASSGIPATYMLSQAALETGWGRQEIRAPDGRNSFNLFGIRAGGNWRGPTVQVWTSEHINGATQRMLGEFRAYASYEESFADYARLIGKQPRYAQVMQSLGDPAAFASALQRAGYATGPRYASALTSVIETTQRLQASVAEVQAALNAPAILAQAPAPAALGPAPGSANTDPSMPSSAQVLQLRWAAIPPMPSSAQALSAARMARQGAYASLDLPPTP